jgi:hypothetical protein
MLADQTGSDDDHVIGVNLDNEYMQGLVVAYDKKRAENQQKARDKKNQVSLLEKFCDDDTQREQQDSLDPSSGN